MNKKTKGLLERREVRGRFISGSEDYPVKYWYIVSRRRNDPVSFFCSQFAVGRKIDPEKDDLKNLYMRKVIASYKYSQWALIEDRLLPRLADPFTVMAGDEVIFRLTSPELIVFVTTKLLMLK